MRFITITTGYSAFNCCISARHYWTAS